MAVSFTTDQKKVIEARGCNLLVSAAAGSGKTAVLVERIAGLVCDETHPVDIDRLLVVTFTKAAAAEMRERVHKRIAEELEKHPHSAHIQKQYTLVHRAQITTIDSFCLSVLRNHFQEIGLDPDFRICDEAEGRLLKEDVLAEVMESSYASKDPAFLAAVEHFCEGSDDAALAEAAMKLYDYAESFPWPEEYYETCREIYRVQTAAELESSELLKEAARYARDLLCGIAEEYDRLLKLCNAPDGPYMFGDLVEKELLAVRTAAEAEGYEAMQRAADQLEAAMDGKLSPKKDPSVDPEKREAVKNRRTKLKGQIRELRQGFFSLSVQDLLEQLQFLALPAEGLIALTARFRQAFLEAKKKKRIVDFGDQEHFALEILLQPDESGQRVPTPVALEYREHFAEIMIDEYQDSNYVQERILSAISGESEGRFNRFMVGDVKQSIYGFRQAKPELFMEKYGIYTGEGNKRKVDLKQNFRSRREVLEVTNAVFARLMHPLWCGIDYDDNAALNYGANYSDAPGMSAEYLSYPADQASVLGRAWDKEMMEALVIGLRILELTTQAQVTRDREGKILAAAQYRDIVILHRSPGTVVGQYRKVFEMLGIPLYAASRTGYFEAREVREILQFLRCLNNPRQEIPLFGSMIAVFGGFTEEEAAQIRVLCPAGNLYDALLSAAGLSEDGEAADPSDDGKAGAQGRIPSVLQRKAGDFVLRLQEYRRQAGYLGVRRLLQQIFDDYDYLDYLSALPAGDRRRANAELFLTRAADYEETSYHGLYHFVRYMDRLQKYNQELGQADLLDENANVVRLMSIHQSKGLEFPIVIVGGISHQFNLRDVNAGLVLDDRLGLGIQYVDPLLRLKRSTMQRDVIQRHRLQGALGEELRILYVAMTRAREKLILADGSGAAADSAEGHTFASYMKARSFAQFLEPILGALPLERREISPEDLVRDTGVRELSRSGLAEELSHAEKYADAEKLRQLADRFASQYPYQNLENLFTKTTVSELKMAALAQAEEGEPSHPLFETQERKHKVPAFRRTEQGPTGTMVGNAYHRLMERMDFDRVLGSALGGMPADYADYSGKLSAQREEVLRALEDFLREECAAGRIRTEAAEVIRRDRILRFFASELAWRMWRAQRAGTLKKEQPFVFGISADRLAAQAPDETVLIQGIIDAYFEEDGKIVLLDYKTDHIASPADLWDRYRVQMDYYRQALEKLTGLPVSQRFLYSFHLGEAAAD